LLMLARADPAGDRHEILWRTCLRRLVILKNAGAFIATEHFFG
jgi:hypothetical protein